MDELVTRDAIGVNIASTDGEYSSVRITDNTLATQYYACVNKITMQIAKKSKIF